jgi:hypothetical protein
MVSNAGFNSGDQVIRENPASRGTEASAEGLVGPPGRMVSNAGQQFKEKQSCMKKTRKLVSNNTGKLTPNCGYIGWRAP